MKLKKIPKGTSTVHVPDDILKDVENQEMDRYSMFLFAVLLSYADNKRQCYPSLDTLCEHNKCSKKTIIKRLKELESGGYINIEKRHHKSNLYTLLKIPRRLQDRTIVSRELVMNNNYSVDEKIMILCTLNDAELDEANPEKSSARLQMSVNQICKMCGMSRGYGIKVISNLTSKSVFNEFERGFIINLDLIGQAFLYLNNRVDNIETDIHEVKSDVDEIKIKMDNYEQQLQIYEEILRRNNLLNEQ